MKFWKDVNTIRFVAEAFDGQFAVVCRIPFTSIELVLFRGSGKALRSAYYGPELPAKLEQARALLNRVNMEDPPDREWCRDYFLFNGDHMILVDGNWEEASALKDYRDEDPEFEPDDEVNAPA